jgi:hypothetical protein
MPLQRTAAEAGRQQLKAKADNEDATNQRVLVTLPPATAESFSSKKNLNLIIKDIVSRNDRDAMKKILSKRGISYDANASAAELADKVGNELRNARTPDQIKTLADQFKLLNLWKE